MSEPKQSQQIQITPEKALAQLNEVAEKYQGTRGDHQVLTASVNLLNQVVMDWRRLKEIEDSEKVSELKPKKKGKRPLKRKSKKSGDEALQGVAS